MNDYHSHPMETEIVPYKQEDEEQDVNDFLKQMEELPKKITQLAAIASTGYANPLRVYITLKRIETALEGAISEAQPLAIDEADNYGNGEHTAFGAKFNVKNAAGRWDFKGVSRWNELKSDLTNLEDGLKFAYGARQKIGATSVDETTGEVEELPTYTPGKTTISIKLS